MAAVSSMGSRRVPGAMPRNVERHFTVPTLLEERTATLRLGSGDNLDGFESRLMGSSYNAGSLAGAEEYGGASLNKGTYKTTNSVYGEEYRTANGASRSGMDTASPAFQSGKENCNSTTTIGRPITGRDAIELPPSKYPAPTSFPSFPKSPTRALSGSLSSQPSATCRPAEEGQTMQASADRGPKRYAQLKPSEWEKAMERTLDGLAPPTRCNGYGQALSTKAKLTQAAVRGSDAASDGCGLSSAAEQSVRGTFRVKKIVEEECNPGVSVEHAAYTNPKGRVHEASYKGSHTGYTSGYSRNNPTGQRVVPSGAEARSQGAMTVKDIHPSVARLIRLKDPMEHSNLVNPNTFATTYNETIDATAKTVSRVQH